MKLVFLQVKMLIFSKKSYLHKLFKSNLGIGYKLYSKILSEFERTYIPKKIIINIWFSHNFRGNGSYFPEILLTGRIFLIYQLSTEFSGKIIVKRYVCNFTHYPTTQKCSLKNPSVLDLTKLLYWWF